MKRPPPRTETAEEYQARHDAERIKREKDRAKGKEREELFTFLVELSQKTPYTMTELYRLHGYLDYNNAFKDQDYQVVFECFVNQMAEKEISVGLMISCLESLKSAKK